MVILSKGSKVSLSKAAAESGVSGALDRIMIGLGWDTQRYDGAAEFDLDASVFLLNDSGKVSNDSDFVFYNNKVAPGVEHMGDNRNGEGEGDDEVINVTLSQLSPNVSRIAVAVTIFDADVRNQNFGMVENSYVRIVDANSGTEILHYDLGEDFSIETSVVVAELYLHNGEWKFNAIGSGFNRGLKGLCDNYGVNT